MAHSVLIGDDTDHVRRLISVILSRHGYELREAEDGQATLDELNRARPDLLILDVHMPGLDGLEVLKHVRADPGLAETRVLLLTGGVEALDSDWGQRVGADAHLAKPFEADALLTTVQALLDG